MRSRAYKTNRCALAKIGTIQRYGRGPLRCESSPLLSLSRDWFCTYSEHACPNRATFPKSDKVQKT